MLLLQLFVHVVLYDSICVSSVSCQLMCAATDLCVICVWTTMLIVIMSAKYRNCTYVSCIIAYCDRSKCDRVGDVYCVNCDNVSEVL